MQDITTMLCNLIDTHEPVWRQFSHIHPNIAYVIGGLCDLTEKRKYRDWRGIYEEVIVEFDHEHALDYIDSVYHSSEYRIKQKGVTPVFATITTMDLENWNSHRNSHPVQPWKRRKTDYLLFQSEYPKMQWKLNNQSPVLAVYTAGGYLPMSKLVENSFIFECHQAVCCAT